MKATLQNEVLSVENIQLIVRHHKRIEEGLNVLLHALECQEDPEVLKGIVLKIKKDVAI